MVEHSCIYIICFCSAGGGACFVLLTQNQVCITQFEGQDREGKEPSLPPPDSTSVFEKPLSSLPPANSSKATVTQNVHQSRLAIIENQRGQGDNLLNLRQLQSLPCHKNQNLFYIGTCTVTTPQAALLPGLEEPFALLCFCHSTSVTVSQMEGKDGHGESRLSFGWPDLWREQSPDFSMWPQEFLVRPWYYLLTLWNTGSQFYAHFQTLTSIAASFFTKAAENQQDPTKEAPFAKLYQTQKDWGGEGKREMRKNKQAQILVTDGDKSQGTIKSNLNTK